MAEEVSASKETDSKEVDPSKGNIIAFKNGPDDDGSDSSSSTTSEEDDDGDLSLDGALVRNPDASSSSSDDEDDEDGDDEIGGEDNGNNKAAFVGSPPKSSDSKKRPVSETRSGGGDGKSKKPSAATKATKTKKKKKRRSSPSPDTIQVSFTFHDMDEKFFHGLRSLLHNSSTVYQPHSSELADLMIDNVSVGTLISTEGDDEHNVYGFASVLNLRTYGSSEAIQNLCQLCLRNCPQAHLDELRLVLSGSTKRPAGLILHGRMVNLPLDITLVLHQQLVLDMDWAVKNSEGGEEERKSLDFGAFVRIAPCQSQRGGGGALLYRFFDDEVFAGRAEFSFTMDAPKSYSKEDTLKLQVMVLTKTGHRQAMKDLEQMIGTEAAS